MYEAITPESLAEDILRKISAFSTDEGSFARTLIAPAAYEIWKAYTALEGVPDMIFIDENSGPYIDKKAADFGITRKPGAKAAGTITLTGRAGTIIPEGKVFLTADGRRAAAAKRERNAELLQDFIPAKTAALPPYVYANRVSSRRESKNF